MQRGSRRTAYMVVRGARRRMRAPRNNVDLNVCSGSRGWPRARKAGRRARVAGRCVGTEGRTREGERGRQECRRGGGHRETRAGGEQRCRHGAGTTEVLAWKRTRRDKGRGERRHGQAGGTDSMTVSKYKLIREEKRRKENKQGGKQQQDATVSPRAPETSAFGAVTRSRSITRHPRHVTE